MLVDTVGEVGETGDDKEAMIERRGKKKRR